MNEFFYDFFNEKTTFIWTIVIFVFVAFVFYFFRFMLFEIKVETQVNKQIEETLRKKKQKGEL